MARRQGLVENANDPAEVRKAAKIAERQRFQEVEDLRALLGEPIGRRVVWWLLSHCGTFESVFRGDPYTTAHASGRQDHGHWLLNEIEGAAPAALSLMIKEAKNREQARRDEAESARLKRAATHDDESGDEDDGG